MCRVSGIGKNKELFMIDKSKKPHCFKKLKKIPVCYAANSNVWMTSSLFKKWLQAWHRELEKTDSLD